MHVNWIVSVALTVFIVEMQLVGFIKCYPEISSLKISFLFIGGWWRPVHVNDTGFFDLKLQVYYSWYVVLKKVLKLTRYMVVANMTIPRANTTL